MVELDKSQKKIARTLISRALERECCTFLAKLKRLLQDEKAQSCHEKYLEIYKSIQTFDKDISRQYDGLNGSRYALTVFSLFYNGILTEKDLSEFDDRTREAFLEHRRQWSCKPAARTYTAYEPGMQNPKEPRRKILSGMECRAPREPAEKNSITKLFL